MCGGEGTNYVKDGSLIMLILLAVSFAHPFLKKHTILMWILSIDYPFAYKYFI